MKKLLPVILLIVIYSAANSQTPKYYSVPEVKGYFTFYKNNTINQVYNDTLSAAFNKRNDTLYQIVFFSSKKVLTKCDCSYRGIETKEYAWIKKADGKVVREPYTVKQLTLKDTVCLKTLPAIVRSTK
jgi:hypothetical protein